MLGSLPGLYPLDSRYNTIPGQDSQKCLQTLPDVPGEGGNITRSRITVLNQIGICYYLYALSHFLKNGLYVALSL